MKVRKTPPPPFPLVHCASDQFCFQFMQRAAASPTSTSPQTLLDNPQTPPAKRQKIITPSSAPAPLSDLQAVKEALKAEEDRRVEALDRLAAVAGETKWVLSCVDGGEAEGKGARSLRVLTTGYSEIDRGDFNVNSGHGHEGRRRFGKFNYKLEVRLKEIIMNDLTVFVLNVH